MTAYSLFKLTNGAALFGVVAAPVVDGLAPDPEVVLVVGAADPLVVTTAVLLSENARM